MRGRETVGRPSTQGCSVESCETFHSKNLELKNQENFKLKIETESGMSL